MLQYSEEVYHYIIRSALYLTGKLINTTLNYSIIIGRVIIGSLFRFSPAWNKKNPYLGIHNRKPYYWWRWCIMCQSVAGIMVINQNRKCSLLHKPRTALINTPLRNIKPMILAFFLRSPILINRTAAVCRSVNSLEPLPSVLLYTLRGITVFWFICFDRTVNAIISPHLDMFDVLLWAPLRCLFCLLIFSDHILSLCLFWNRLNKGLFV